MADATKAAPADAAESQGQSGPQKEEKPEEEKSGKLQPTTLREILDLLQSVMDGKTDPTAVVEPPAEALVLKERVRHADGYDDDEDYWDDYGEGGGDYNAWAKGTGFGHALDQSDWDLRKWKQQRVKMDYAVAKLLADVDALLTAAEKPKRAVGAVEDTKADDTQPQDAADQEFADTVAKSSLMQAMQDYLKNDSLSDMVQHHGRVYAALFRLLKRFCGHERLLRLVVEAGIPQRLADVHGSASTVALFAKAEKEGTQKSDTMQSAAASGQAPLPDGMTPVLDAAAESQPDPPAETQPEAPSEKAAPAPAPETESVPPSQEEAAKDVPNTDMAETSVDAMLALIVEVHEAIVASQEKVKTDTQDAKEEDTKADEPASAAPDAEKDKEAEEARLRKQYMKAMKRLRFGTVDDDTFAEKHKYKDNPTKVSRATATRLGFEYADLSKSLPINWDSSIFLRVCEAKMNLAKMAIIPSFDTPYGGGVFLFDAYFPTNYPDSCPKLHFVTTGRGSVYFNPNLYSCGKVCLSLLGTWQAAVQGESWNPGISTFLQVAISLQSLVFVEEPYFNEPGYEQQMGTESGTKQSENYNKNIRTQTVRWAMVDLLKTPPKEFAEVITTHFRLQKERVTKQAVEWLGEEHDLVKELKELLGKL